MAAAGSIWAARLFGDDEIAALFGDDAMYARYLSYEVALASALGDSDLASPVAVKAAMDAMASFQPDFAAIDAALAKDGLPIPEWTRQLKAHVAALAGAEAKEAVHRGATSQDVIDTATFMACRDAAVLFDTRLSDLRTRLDALLAANGDNALMAITRMQPALAFTAGDRIRAWIRPLVGLQDDLRNLQSELAILQFAGPVGDLSAFGDSGPRLAEVLAAQLGLGWAGLNAHADRTAIVRFADVAARLTGALGKIGQDVALMALRGKADIALTGGGGSSAMPHKQNPVGAELLVTLARHNATLIAGIHQSMVHEQERSGAAWSLEWLILPRMAEAAGASLTTANALVGSIESIGERASPETKT